MPKGKINYPYHFSIRLPENLYRYLKESGNAQRIIRNGIRMYARAKRQQTQQEQQTEQAENKRVVLYE